MEVKIHDRLSVKPDTNVLQGLQRLHLVQLAHISTMCNKQIALRVQLDISATAQAHQVPSLLPFVRPVVLVQREQRQIKEYFAHLDTGNRKLEELLASRVQRGTIAISLG